MPIPDWLTLTLWRVWGPVFWLGVLTAVVALALSFGRAEHRRQARLLWPLSFLAVWIGADLFIGFAVLSDPDNYVYGMGLERLGLPAVLLLVGGVPGLWWLRASLRSRHRSAQAGVAA
jgi:hypothetical protein